MRSCACQTEETRIVAGARAVSSEEDDDDEESAVGLRRTRRKPPLREEGELSRWLQHVLANHVTICRELVELVVAVVALIVVVALYLTTHHIRIFPEF